MLWTSTALLLNSKIMNICPTKKQQRQFRIVVLEKPLERRFEPSWAGLSAATGFPNRPKRPPGPFRTGSKSPPGVAPNRPRRLQEIPRAPRPPKAFPGPSQRLLGRQEASGTLQSRANQAWRSGHQAPTSHGSATMVGRPPPAVQPVRIKGWFVVRRLCPDQPSRVARKISKRLESD